MKAITIPEPGDADALVLDDVPVPELGPGEVLVTVAAAGVNRADLMQRQGFYDPPPGASPYPGLEVSGTVAAVGEQVEGWSVGDEVCALLAGGGYAEQVAVPAGQLLPVPAGVSLRRRRGAARGGLHGLVQRLPHRQPPARADAARPRRLSGIGTMAIQLAREVGAHVAVTAGSAAKLEACRELGAEILVNYREQDFVEVRARAHRRRTAPTSSSTTWAPSTSPATSTPWPRAAGSSSSACRAGPGPSSTWASLLRKRAAVIATSLRARPAAEKATIVAAVREHVWPLIESGRVRPIVHGTYPLAAAADAHRELEASSHIGKVLLTP